MSWDSYIDNTIAHSKLGEIAQIDKVAIIGQNGALWTSHNHANSLKLGADEALVIGQAFANNDMSRPQSAGLMIEGKKYQFLRGDDEAMILKLKDNGSITCAASSTAVVVAHCIEGGQLGQVNIATNVISEYLKSLNM
jgi:profilin